MFNRVGVFYNELKTQVTPYAQKAAAFLREKKAQVTLLTSLDNLPDLDTVKKYL